MPLTIAQLDTDYVIQKITGLEEVKKHLGNLGFVKGASIRVVNTLAGNLIVRVKDVDIAIGKELAMKIFV